MSVYFITARELGRVKIGFTAGDPHARRSALQTGCPSRLRLEAVIPGDASVEAALHLQFAQHRIVCEWFVLADEIEQAIARGRVEPRPWDVLPGKLGEWVSDNNKTTTDIALAVGFPVKALARELDSPVIPRRSVMAKVCAATQGAVQPLDLIADKEAAAAQLLSFIERLESLEKQRHLRARDLADTYAEAKLRGFDRATIRQALLL